MSRTLPIITTSECMACGRALAKEVTAEAWSRPTCCIACGGTAHLVQRTRA